VANIGAFRCNQTIAIWGAGPVGLLAMAVAKALGASRIVAVDINPGRLKFAKTYAATETFIPPAPEPGETKMDYSRRSSSLMKQQLGIDDRGSKAIDVVVDASGAEVSIQTAIHIVKPGGTYVQVRALKTSALFFT
jgi:D-xylulose reductase